MDHSNVQKGSITLLRVAFGWMFFYAGITKVLDPSWSAAGYLNNAGTFPEYFALLTDPSILPIVNMLNEWGLMILGAALILGLFVRTTALLSALLMLLYYLPVLEFPYAGNGYIVNEHIIYIFALGVIAAYRGGALRVGKMVRG